MQKEGKNIDNKADKTVIKYFTRDKMPYTPLSRNTTI